MKIDPDIQPPKGSGQKTGPSSGKQEAPKTNFGDALAKQLSQEESLAARMGSGPLKQSPPPLKEQPKQKEKEKEKDKPKTGQQQQAPISGEGKGQQAIGGVVGQASSTGGAGASTQAERVADVFRAGDQFYGGAVQTVNVSGAGAQTNVSVMLANGITINVDITAGRELNVTVNNISAKLQAELDNRENQQFLSKKLADQGFQVNIIQTHRGEEYKPMTAPTAEEAKEQAGKEGEPGEEKEGQQK